VYRASASASAGSDDSDSVEDYYRIFVFYPVLSEILQDLQLRFGPQQQLAANIGRVVPAFMDFDDADSSDVETFGRQVLMSNLSPIPR